MEPNDKNKAKRDARAAARAAKAEQKRKDESAKDIQRYIDKIQHDTLVKDSSALINTLYTEDDFRSVVLGHAWIENALVLLIERHLHRKKALNVAQLGYQQKLRFALALSELEEFEVPLMSALGDVRNKFAHRLNAVILLEDSEEVTKAALKDESSAKHMDVVTGLFLAVQADDKSGRQLFNYYQSTVRAGLFLAHLTLATRLNHDKPVLPEDVDWVREHPDAPGSLVKAIMAGLKSSSGSGEDV